MKKIAIITSTRAEYGLLTPVIKKFKEFEDVNLKVDLIVTGTHLLDKYGMTINEIVNDKLQINKKIEISMNSTNELDISTNMSDALIKFTKVFSEIKYNAVIILGDRYEMLSIAIAAMNCNTPIFHLCGGDTTEGAIDECIRHAISKMSFLHFTTNEESRKRVIQLGEASDRVFNVGSTSVDNILNSPLYSSKEMALNAIGLQSCSYALFTFHPTTLDNHDIENQMKILLNTTEKFPSINFIFTKANADLGGSKINDFLDCESKKRKNIFVYDSLGMIKYLSLMKYALFIIGNSSSGIIESPIFHKPTINIGDRQKGRLQCGNIINVDLDEKRLEKSIILATSLDFKNKCKGIQNPFGDGKAADKIVNISLSFLKNEINLKKKFYDIEVDI